MKLPGVETVRDEVVVVAASLQGGQMVGVSSTKLENEADVNVGSVYMEAVAALEAAR